MSVKFTWSNAFIYCCFIFSLAIYKHLKHKKLPSFFPLIIFLLLLTVSCKSKKEILTTTSLKPQTSEFLMTQLAENQVNAQWLTAKTKIAFDNNNQIQRAYSTIKMRKDSIIWMNIKKLGIEAARVQVTPDSVYLIDRINGQYSIKGLNFITEKFNLPANFSTLQNFLLGNAVFFTRSLSASNDDLNYQLLGETDRLVSQYWLNGISYQLTKMYFSEKEEKRQLVSTLSDYRPINETQNFSYFRSIDLDSTEMGKVKVEFNFTEVEINQPTTIRFSIPDHYERID